MFDEFETAKEDLPELSEEYKIETDHNANCSFFQRSIMGDTSSPCLSAVLDPFDQYVIGCYANGSIKCFDPHGGGLVKTIKKESESNEDPITSVLRFRPGGEATDHESVVLTGDMAGSIIKYDVAEGNLTEKIEWTGDEANSIFSIDYNSNGRQFASAGLDKIVRIYDDIAMKCVQELDPFKSGHAGHSARIFCVKFNKQDPNILISGGWDNTIIIYDIREKGPVSSIIGADISGEALDFSDKKILSGSNRLDKQLQIWDLESTDLLETISWNGTGHFKDREETKVFCCKFFTHTDTNKEYILAGGGGVTNEIRIFNESREPIGIIGDFSRACYTCDISPIGDSILCAGGDGVMRLFRLMFGVDMNYD